MTYSPLREIQINGKSVGLVHPTYFIADIAANHDGDLNRAKDLIHLAAEAGADAVKFQHFSASTIVSDYGFKSLGKQVSHQASWSKSVYEIYEDASIDLNWTPVLKEVCDQVGITFFTSPYSLRLVDAVDPYVSAYKIGSGDITWHEIIGYMACKGKPVLLATGASSMLDVQTSVEVVLKENPQIILMQCNTNYTASLENFRYIQLNVLKTYSVMYPTIILGLSDHTLGFSTVMGAVALGARVIEKHFTDDQSRIGPDHKFSMDPVSWKKMIVRTRELQMALGSGVKKVEENELETVVVQRRAIRTTRYLHKGTVLKKEDLTVLRPCPEEALPPYCMDKIIGRKTTRELREGEDIQWTDLA